MKKLAILPIWATNICMRLAIHARLRIGKMAASLAVGFIAAIGRLFAIGDFAIPLYPQKRSDMRDHLYWDQNYR
jgi:hypothetical protein